MMVKPALWNREFYAWVLQPVQGADIVASKEMPRAGDAMALLRGLLIPEPK
jgi:hypothetical protein